jgi:hypothetical protein
MRLWSIHPKYLDKKGLVGLWRESLLAKKVLEGKTKGYKNHPQLIRFKESENKLLYLNHYLYEVYKEGKKRNYKFNFEKINKSLLEKRIKKIPITNCQLKYEFNHLKNKLIRRDKKHHNKINLTKSIKSSNIFTIKKGKICHWEKIKV